MTELELKAAIFDILEEQDRYKIAINQLDKQKQTLLVELKNQKKEKENG